MFNLWPSASHLIPMYLALLGRFKPMGAKTTLVLILPIMHEIQMALVVTPGSERVQVWANPAFCIMEWTHALGMVSLTALGDLTTIWTQLVLHMISLDVHLHSLCP